VLTDQPPDIPEQIGRRKIILGPPVRDIVETADSDTEEVICTVAK
jgi:hypothetical protein